MQVSFWSIIDPYICNKITDNVMFRRTRATMELMQAYDQRDRPGSIRPDCIFVDLDAIVAARNVKGCRKECN